MIGALEREMRVKELWHAGSSLLDIGCGPSWIGAYLQASLGVRVVGYEVPFTAQCEWFLRSPFAVNFMTHEDIPRVPVAERSHDGVSMLNVLHHVANRTPAVLEQAAAIARSYILLTEDFCHSPRSKYCRWLKTVHDRKAVYRTPEEWRLLFAIHCAAFDVIRFGHLSYKNTYQDKPGEITVSVSGSQPGVIYFVLKRNMTRSAVGSQIMRDKILED